MTARPVSCRYLALRYLKIHIVTTVRINRNVYKRMFRLSIRCVFRYFSSISISVPAEGLPFTRWRRRAVEIARTQPSPTPAIVCLQLLSGSINPEELRDKRQVSIASHRGSPTLIGSKSIVHHYSEDIVCRWSVSMRELCKLCIDYVHFLCTTFVLELLEMKSCHNSNLWCLERIFDCELNSLWSTVIDSMIKVYLSSSRDLKFGFLLIITSF